MDTGSFLRSTTVIAVVVVVVDIVVAVSCFVLLIPILIHTVCILLEYTHPEILQYRVRPLQRFTAIVYTHMYANFRSFFQPYPYNLIFFALALSSLCLPHKRPRLLCSTTKNLHLVSINKFERSRFYPPFQTKGKINHNKRTLHQTIAEWKWNEMNLKFCTLLNGKLYGTICVQLDGFSNFS